MQKMLYKMLQSAVPL